MICLGSICRNLGIGYISILKFIIWAILYYFFIQIEFGIVFFFISAFYFIFMNMGNESNEKKDRVSAYSVFNKGGQQVLGSFNTNQLEKSFGLPDYSS